LGGPERGVWGRGADWNHEGRREVAIWKRTPWRAGLCSNA
jgi:hypothetical protein